ncbi:MAG TPA: hypothetical protein VGE02_06485 [Gemmatimonadales bacterium]
MTASPSDAPEASAEELERALSGDGLRCTVEARGRLAIVRAGDAAGATSALGDPDARARIVALAREHGFTHAALEL